MQESRKAGKNAQRQKPMFTKEVLAEAKPKPQGYGQMLSTESLFSAALDGDIWAIRQSLDSGADMDARDKDGQTPLHYAIKHGGPKACAMLLDSGADMEAKDNDGNTALHHAANGGKNEICSILTGRGADINTKDNDGNTPLHCAAWAGHIDICALLAENGANVTARDNRGWAPWRRAAWAEHTDVVEFFSSISLNGMRSYMEKEEYTSFMKSFGECVSGGV
jgi:ankyrin repeat protein